MKFTQIVRSFFQVVSRMTREDRENRITFSDQVYMRLPHTEVTLVSLGIDNIQTMKLSINDAREIFRSIKSALDMREINETKIGDLYWKTDGRLDSADRERVVIEFNGPLGFTHAIMKRGEVSAAVAEFTKKFNLN